MDVKPWEPVVAMDFNSWEPVSHEWKSVSGWGLSFISKDRNGGLCNRGDDFVIPCRVTLANGQRIIVRALSEDRKAARAAMKEA